MSIVKVYIKITASVGLFLPHDCNL